MITFYIQIYASINLSFYMNFIYEFVIFLSMIFLPLPPKSWDYECVLPCLVLMKKFLF